MEGKKETVLKNSTESVDVPLWRLTMLARLAEERANLLRQLRGIDAQTLVASLVSDNWTAKDILAHLGVWDSLQTERMSLVLNGRINAIKEIGDEEAMESRNVEIHTLSQSLSFEQALAICLKERSGLLAALNRIPDDLMHLDLELPWGWHTNIQEWADWRWQHDAHHAQALQEWRSQLPREQKRQVGPVDLLRAYLKATRKELTTLVDHIPAAERVIKPVCGIWTLKDLVGHLTDWELVGLAGLRQLVAGLTPKFNEQVEDFDEWNNAHAAARRDQPWDVVWRAFEETRNELMRLLDEMKDDVWQRPFSSPWGTEINGYFWMVVWADHEQEHAADVRAALNLMAE
jgi:hypothetical protein